MFHEIDYENWPRRDIYELFDKYTYCITVDIDITEFLKEIHEKGYKFYPSVCWCIAKVVNSDPDFRMCKKDGKLGYYDVKDPMYTVRRTCNGLFAHNITEYSDDFEDFYQRFLVDKANAEQTDQLYYKPCTMETVHISATPNTTFKAMSFHRPAEFMGYGKPDTNYSPFVVVGKYREVDGRVLMPINVEMHHNVNDGFHAEKFIRMFQETCSHFRITRAQSAE